MFDWLRILGSIILIDLVLSGDNALIIGAAVARLSKRWRLFALLFGGGGAIVLRIIFAGLATLALQIPLIKAIGGLLLIGIAVKLLMERRKGNEQEDAKAQGKTGLLSAFSTILVADLIASLDNILSVAALANGNLLLLGIGLLVSIVCLLTVSAFIAKLIARLPWLVDVASLVLAWTAASMIIEDVHVRPMVAVVPQSEIMAPALLVVLMLGVCIWSRRVALAKAI